MFDGMRLKRVGVLAMILTAGAFVQPVFAKGNFEQGARKVAAVNHERQQFRDNPRFVAEYRAPVKQDRDRTEVRRDLNRDVRYAPPVYERGRVTSDCR